MSQKKGGKEKFEDSISGNDSSNEIIVYGGDERDEDDTIVEETKAAKFMHFMGEVKNKLSPHSMKLMTLELIYRLFFLLRLSKTESFETNMTIAQVYFIQLSAYPSQICLLALVFIPALYLGFEYFQLVPIGFIVISWIITTFLFCMGWIFKFKRELLIHASGFFMVLLFTVGLLFSSANLLLVKHFMVVVMMPAFFIVSVAPPYYYLWPFMSFFVFFCYFIYQLVRILIENKTYELSTKEVVHIFVMNFLCDAFVFYWLYFNQIMFVVKIQSFQKKITGIAEAITKLDFNSKYISDLIEFPEHLSDTLTSLLRMICINVKEYKSYLPQGLVNQEIGSTQQKLESSKELSSCSSESSSDHTNSNKSGSQKSDRLIFPLSGHSSNGSKKERDFKKTLIDYSLMNRYGTFVMIDLENWGRMIREKRTESLVDYYRCFVEVVNEELKKFNGVVLSLTNEKIVCCWNIKNIVVRHEEKACSFATRLLFLFEDSKSKVEFPFKVHIRMSVATGSVLCGNMGYEELRTYNYFGVVNELLFVLNRMCKQVKNRSIILIANKTKESTKYGFNFLFINNIQLYGEESTRKVYEMIAQRKKKVDEWFYEIEDELKGNEIKKDDEEADIFQLNDSLEENFMKSHFEAASILIDSFKGAIFTELKDNISLKKQFTLCYY